MKVSREDRERYDIPHVNEIQKEKIEKEKEIEQATDHLLVWASGKLS